jgi:CRAL/TRIO domain
MVPDMTDHLGRTILLYDASRIVISTVGAEPVMRIFWYMLHVALERESTQRHGIIVLVDTKNFKAKHFHLETNKQMLPMLQSTLPIRLSAFFICYPTSVMKVVMPIVKQIINARMKKRIVMTGSTPDAILSTLSKYELTSDIIPSDVGGDIVIDHAKWVQDRRVREQQTG